MSKSKARKATTTTKPTTTNQAVAARRRRTEGNATDNRDESPINPCELCGTACGIAYVSHWRCNDTGLGVVLHRTCARTLEHMRDEVALAVLEAAAGARRVLAARDVIATTDAALDHARAIVEASTRELLAAPVARSLTVEVLDDSRPFDAAFESELVRDLAHTFRTRAVHCYACDGAVVGVRDRRYMGGRVEFACERHAESNTEAAAAVQIGRAIALSGNAADTVEAVAK